MWKAMTYFALSVPNRSGELANFAAQLRDAGINLVGLWGHDGGQGPRLSIVPESGSLFREFMSAAGIDIEEGRVFYCDDEDRPGALVEALQRVTGAGINLEAIECVAAGDRFGCFVWAHDRDWDALDRVLT